MKLPRILLADDHQILAEGLRCLLEPEFWIVATVYDGRQMIETALQERPDVIIADISMPVLNGLDLCRQLREKDESTPVLMLTALGMSDDIVAGLEAGADDYLSKPFRFNELYARVKALTRRKKIFASNNEGANQDSKKVFRLADLQIDFDGREVQRGAKRIQLTAKEYALLEYLARNTGKVRSRLEIAEAVWGLDFETGTNFIDVYISYLRNKVDKPFDVKLIQTITGFGYVLKLPQP
jgi:DNA-binding response OmpR family regulator